MKRSLQPASPPDSTSPLDELFDELLELMEELIGQHEALRTALAEHRDAIRRSDSAALGACLERESMILQSIGEMETRRRALAEGITRQRGPAAVRVKVQQLAQHAPEPRRTALLQAGERLRAVVEGVQAHQRVIREATGSLLLHVDGIMHQLAAMLSHAGLYSPRGRVGPAGAPVVSALDVTH